MKLVIMIAILQNVLGDLIDITRFLNDINHQYLNFVNFTTLNMKHREFSDEDVAALTDIIANLAKPIAFDNHFEFNHTEIDATCKTNTLVIIPLDLALINANDSCDVKGDFIEKPCHNFLVYSSIRITFDELFYQQLKCNLVHQPFVFILMPHEDSFELVEVQVPMRKTLKLISWPENGIPMLVFIMRYIPLFKSNVIELQNSYHNQNIWIRRKDLNGITLKSFHDPIYHYRSFFDYISNDQYSGISGTILNQMTWEFNFTVDFLPFPGSYTNYVMQLKNYSADFAACQITHNNIRTEMASPGLTLETSSFIGVFWKSPNQYTTFSSIQHIFDETVWLMIGVTLLVIYLSFQISILPFMKCESRKNYLIKVSVAIVQALFGNSFNCNGLYDRRSSGAISILMLTLSTLGFLVFTSFMSIFTSILTVKQLKIPFEALDEISTLSEFKLKSYSSGSIYDTILDKAKRNPKYAEAVAKYVEPYYVSVNESDTYKIVTDWFIGHKGPNVGLLIEKDTYNSILTLDKGTHI